MPNDRAKIESQQIDRQQRKFLAQLAAHEQRATASSAAIPLKIEASGPGPAKPLMAVISRPKVKAAFSTALVWIETAVIAFGRWVGRNFHPQRSADDADRVADGEQPLPGRDRQDSAATVGPAAEDRRRSAS